METIVNKQKEVAAFYAVVTGQSNNTSLCGNMLNRMRQLIAYNLNK